MRQAEMESPRTQWPGVRGCVRLKTEFTEREVSSRSRGSYPVETIVHCGSGRRPGKGQAVIRIWVLHPLMVVRALTAFLLVGTQLTMQPGSVHIGPELSSVDSPIPPSRTVWLGCDPSRRLLVDPLAALRTIVFTVDSSTETMVGVR